MKIAITDSGFGGLSIATELYESLIKSPISIPVEIIFINGLPHETFGYNSLSDTKEKIAIFNNLLTSIDQKLKPDIIVIACNTLSVLLEFTDIYCKISRKTIGITKFGTETVTERLDSISDALIAILGTQTTIKSDVHRRYFKQYPELCKQIIAIPATELVDAIEDDSMSKTTESLIDDYMNQIRSAISLDNSCNKLVMILACTHFPYAMPFFKSKLRNIQIPSMIINPNKFMVEQLKQVIANANTDSDSLKRRPIDFRIISKTFISDDRLNSISKLILRTSPKVESLLKSYEHIPDFFFAGD